MSATKGNVPWNAGTGKGWTDKRGYRWLYLTENGRRRARREHRVIMQQHLGRRLEPWELVHHKDGNPKNNSIENLELQTWGQHTNQHHNGVRHTEYAKTRMHAAALMREEINHLRRVNTDLLAALKDILDARNGGCEEMEPAVSKAISAISKATNGQEVGV